LVANRNLKLLTALLDLILGRKLSAKVGGYSVRKALRKLVASQLIANLKRSILKLLLPDLTLLDKDLKLFLGVFLTKLGDPVFNATANILDLLFVVTTQLKGLTIKIFRCPLLRSAY